MAKGPQQLPPLWSHILNTATVSDIMISEINPHNDVGDYLGLEPPYP